MSARVRLEKRRRSDSAAFRGELEETVILRGEEVLRFCPKVTRCGMGWNSQPRSYARSEPISARWLRHSPGSRKSSKLSSSTSSSECQDRNTAPVAQQVSPLPAAELGQAAAGYAKGVG